MYLTGQISTQIKVIYVKILKLSTFRIMTFPFKGRQKIYIVICYESYFSMKKNDDITEDLHTFFIRNIINWLKNNK